MGIISGEKIREARKNLGFSQDALAKKLGVSKVTICWYENGDRIPSLDNFFKLAEVLKLTPYEMIGKEVNVVAEDEEDYTVRLSKKDLEIISEIKDKKDLYQKLYEDPKRTVQLIERKLK